jgi:hypothetical protein
MGALLLFTVAMWAACSFSNGGNMLRSLQPPARSTRRLLLPELALESAPAKAVAVATATSSDGTAEAVASASTGALSGGSQAEATAVASSVQSGGATTTAVATAAAGGGAAAATYSGPGAWNASMCLWASETCALNPSYLFSLPPPELGAERCGLTSCQ